MFNHPGIKTQMDRQKRFAEALRWTQRERTRQGESLVSSVTLKHPDYLLLQKPFAITVKPTPTGKKKSFSVTISALFVPL